MYATIRDEDGQVHKNKAADGLDGDHEMKKLQWSSRRWWWKKEIAKQKSVSRSLRNRKRRGHLKKIVYKNNEDIRREQGSRRSEAQRKSSSFERETYRTDKILRKQTKQARDGLTVKCRLMPGKAMPKRRPLADLLRTGQCGEMSYKCEEVCDNQEETAETQKERIMKFKAEGDKHFTEDGRIAESRFDLALPRKGQEGGRKRQWI